MLQSSLFSISGYEKYSLIVIITVKFIITPSCDKIWTAFSGAINIAQLEGEGKALHFQDDKQK